MRDTLFAVAKSKSVVEISVSKKFCPFKLRTFRLYADHKPVFSLDAISDSESSSSFIYTISCEDFHFKAGHFYQVVTEQNYFIPIDISFLATTQEFEKQYRFDGQLGAIYSKEETTFRVFSPLSCEITLHIKKKDGDSWETYSMNHDFEHGVFFITCKGDYDGASYLYERFQFGQSVLVADPYSFSLSSNSRWSFVINPERIHKLPSFEECLPPFKDRMQAIIYECDVRDMTSLTDLKNKGTYEALSTSGLKEKASLPVGLDYLASLGVTHVQLLPVLDFQTIDDDNPFSMYNWGYDPVSYFSPEGSYSTDPSDGYRRVIELKELIGAFHQKGMRVVLDVVYNHVFSTAYNPLNVLCPNYYYRHDANGVLSNGTGCGNDLESRNYMVRKLILDSLLHCLDFYDVDGFRFDLMGILDVKTIQMGYELLSKRKKNILYYGEGWDLWTALPADEKASYHNSDKMPFASFFNDRFRDVAKGKSNESEISVRGYLLGDCNYRDGFKHVLLGSSVPLAFVPMFANANQSINYVECHDNHTLYDKIKIACYDDSEEEIKKRIKMNLIATLVSAGIPFFHQGEEIGASKKGLPNTYNAGDELNGFDYQLLDENKDLYAFFKDAISIKKKYLSFDSTTFYEMLKENRITFDDLDCGALKINYEFDDYTLYVVFNPSKEKFMFEFPNYVSLIFNETGILSDACEDIYIHMAIINGLSINIFYEEKKAVESGGKKR